jgi:hypothetical protein
MARVLVANGACGRDARSVDDILPGLQSLPSLTDVNVLPCFAEGELQRVLHALPGLRVLNGIRLSQRSATPLSVSARDRSPGGARAGVVSPPRLTIAEARGAGVNGWDGRSRQPSPSMRRGGGGGGGSMDGDAVVGHRVLGGMDRAVPSREVTLTELDLERVAVLFGSIKALNPRPASDDARLTELFDAHIRRVMSELRTRLDSQSDAYLRQSEILAVRARSCQACCERVGELGRVYLCVVRVFAMRWYDRPSLNCSTCAISNWSTRRRGRTRTWGECRGCCGCVCASGLVC